MQIVQFGVNTMFRRRHPGYLWPFEQAASSFAEVFSLLPGAQIMEAKGTAKGTGDKHRKGLKLLQNHCFLQGKDFSVPVAHTQPVINRVLLRGYIPAVSETLYLRYKYFVISRGKIQWRQCLVRMSNAVLVKVFNVKLCP